MSQSATESAIQEFLLGDLLFDRNLKTLGVDESLLERGLLDSMGVLRLVAFCEERFGVAIPDGEVLPENIESVRAIARLVDRCRRG